MAINRVDLADETLIDISDSTVTKDNLMSGVKAYGADGEEVIGELDLSTKMDKVNPTGTGSLSIGRKPNTTIGAYSTAVGYLPTASGPRSFAEGYETTAKGAQSHAEGIGTIASGGSSHVQGRYNIEDNDGKYVHIVGNGSSSQRSNAHTLDWSGNAWFDGDVENGNGAKLSMISKADVFDGNKTYHKGDFCIEQNVVYEALKDEFSHIYITVTEYWKATSLSEVISNVRNELPTTDTQNSTETSAWVSPTAIPTVSRYGNMCLMSILGQIKAGSYSGYSSASVTNTAVAKLPFTPSTHSNFVIIVGTGSSATHATMRCASNGYLYFNNNITLSSNTWITGQCTYVTND